MAYTPKTWQCNDTITAEDLNHMEQGIADASQGGGGTEPLIVTSNYDESTDEQTLDKTWQEIHDALAENRLVFITSLAGPLVSQYRVQMVANDGGTPNYRVYVGFVDISQGAQSPSYIVDVYGCDAASEHPILYLND